MAITLTEMMDDLQNPGEKVNKSDESKDTSIVDDIVKSSKTDYSGGGSNIEDDKGDDKGKSDDDKKGKSDENNNDEIKLDDSTDQSIKETAEKLIELGEDKLTDAQKKFLEDNTTYFDKDDNDEEEKDDKNKSDDKDVNVKEYWKEVYSSIGYEYDGNTELGGDKDSLVKFGKDILNKTSVNFENSLKANYPFEYSLMLARKSGQDVQELSKSIGDIDFSKISLNKEDFKEDDDDENNSNYLKSAKSIAIKILQYKGLSDSDINDIIKIKEDSGVITDYAKAQLKEAQKIQEDKVKEATDRSEKELIRINQIKKEFATKVYETIKEDKIGNFNLSDEDKNNFFNFISSSIALDKDTFYLTTKITPDNYLNVLQAELLKYKKGDLSDIIKRRANSSIIKDLKNKNEKINIGKKSNSSGGGNSGGYKPLSTIVKI